MSQLAVTCIAAVVPIAAPTGDASVAVDVQLAMVGEPATFTTAGLAETQLHDIGDVVIPNPGVTVADVAAEPAGGTNAIGGV